MTLKTRIFTHHPRVSLTRFTFCWWCHNQLAMSQWLDNCNANMWQVISNSFDINFIHSDIHGRSCKNENYISIISSKFPKCQWVKVSKDIPPTLHQPSRSYMRPLHSPTLLDYLPPADVKWVPWRCVGCHLVATCECRSCRLWCMRGSDCHLLGQQSEGWPVCRKNIMKNINH